LLLAVLLPLGSCVPGYDCTVKQLDDMTIVLEVRGRGILWADARPWDLGVLMLHPYDRAHPWPGRRSMANNMLHLSKVRPVFFARTARLRYRPGLGGEFVLEGEAPKGYEVLEGPKMLQREMYYKLTPGPGFCHGDTGYFFIDARGRLKSLEWEEIRRLFDEPQLELGGGQPSPTPG